MNTAPDGLANEEMLLRYKQTVERVIPHLPAKNGVVDIDSIWVETSIPYELLQTILTQPNLALPEHIERINTKSKLHLGERSGRSKRKRRRKVRH